MEIREAQREVRLGFVGGAAGQLVSAILWLGSAALGTWGTPRHAILFLVIGGFFIFPLTTLVLRLAGHPGRLSRDNPMGRLAMQVAFIVPLSLPLVGAATLYDLTWFYPSFMVVVGAHYLPFTFLYGMSMFAGLAAVLVGGGVALALWGPESFALGGWLTGGVLALAAVVGGVQARREITAQERKGPAGPAASEGA